MTVAKTFSKVFNPAKFDTESGLAILTHIQLLNKCKAVYRMKW